jgi:hypothetical protein
MPTLQQATNPDWGSAPKYEPISNGVDISTHVVATPVNSLYTSGIFTQSTVPTTTASPDSLRQFSRFGNVPQYRTNPLKTLF